MSMSKAPDGMSTSNDSGSKDEGHFTEHIEDYAGHDSVTIHPNAWSKYRLAIREYAAEFLGVCILIIFGTGVDCQVVLSSVTGVASSQKGSYLSISFGWAIGTAMGVWVSGGISGGHINPAVTIALATYRGFPWKKVPGYIAAQTLGGLVGAALVYANYYHAITIFEGGTHVRTLATASLFSTYALDYMTAVSCFFSEFLATAVLLVVVLAINDKKNCPPPAGLAPLVLFVLILGIGACLGMETAYAINPARDLGPRLLTSMVGYGKQVYTYRNHYWLWCPIIAPILGAQAGSIFYDAFIYTGEESPFNRPNAAARAHHARALRAGRRNMPAGPGAEDRV
ncbi:major intrinsic protein superfamily membrane channel protein [Mycena albidolilacea]|uniref:Major intrinsic protein superfamily membrane channel protein n=1 Tax=Mycena albidolilacea TaxID=1033008 RepID=A0AAD7ASK3_9AGAR|nr:major intrinsic protein superfamily membrane channel protein [Mycena albidolilacea]